MKKPACKSPTGRRPAHSPAAQVHPSIPSITRTVCAGCGKVLAWTAPATLPRIP